ncbi:MAG TPA: 23S rRNA (guanosine(2251)-2'-O)-methyltransferase RlmB [Azospirillum sp.]|nr:23S rRNA (guanosine(2251)-2'-O)-methyltransferase RlmB [Azospirillum sp.]
MTRSRKSPAHPRQTERLQGRQPAPERRAGQSRPLEKHGGGHGELLYGLHPVAAAWANPERRCRRLLVTDSGRAALAEVLERTRAAGIARPDPTPAERADLERLLPPGAVHQGVVLDAGPLPEVGIEEVCVQAGSDSNALVVVLDQVTDPHNVGAVLRSASAFGAKAVLVTERHAPEVTGVLAKSASGALEAVPLVRVTNLVRALGELQQAGFWCVGLAESGKRTLAELDLSGRTAIVLGAEGSGLRRLTMERCDEIVRLPTQGPVGSLNVSNAAAVSLYEVARRRG